MMYLMTTLTTKGQSAYAEAGGVAAEAFAGIRTVASFCAEELSLRIYKQKLDPATKIGIQRGFLSGAGMGVSFLTFFGTYALCLWYGGQLVMDDDYTGGKVLTVCAFSSI